MTPPFGPVQFSPDAARLSSVADRNVVRSRSPPLSGAFEQVSIDIERAAEVPMARIAVRLALGMMVAAGCTGSIDSESPPGDSESPGTTPGLPGGSPGTGTRPGDPSTPGSPPAPGTPGAMASGPLAPAAMQRLTAVQYRNAVRDLLGTTVTP